MDIRKLKSHNKSKTKQVMNYVIYFDCANLPSVSVLAVKNDCLDTAENPGWQSMRKKIIKEALS